MKILLFVIFPLQGDAISTGTFIQEILGSPAGSFASVFGILLLAGWLIYFVTKHATKFKCDNEEHKGKVGKVEESLGGINRDIAYIRGSIDIIMGSASNPTVQAHSPISLTDFGKTLSAEIGLEGLIANNWSKIVAYLDGNLQSMNAYDIQQFCIDTASVNLDKFFSLDDLNSVKNFAFKKGKPLMYYGGMIGVLIRDAYFKYKGIHIDEVDKHDPTRQS